MNQSYLEIAGTVVELSRKVGANEEDALASSFLSLFSLPLPVSPFDWTQLETSWGLSEKHRLLFDMEQIREKAKNGT